MNLIEQLGGYEASKNILLRKRYDHVAYSVDSNSFYDHEAAEHGGIDVRDLDDELLEYRRENNIFEVGDLIVLLHTNYRSDVFALTKSFKEIYDEKGMVYRHATNEEIKAGRRLSKIKCWSCDKEMSHSDRAENDGFCIHCNAEIEL